MSNLLCFLLGFPAAILGDIAPWSIYYGHQAAAEDFKPYQLIVLDAQNHPPLNYLLESRRMVLGYLNVGEISKNSDYFKDIDPELLLEQNPNWSDSVMVDLRNPLWAQFVIEKHVPQILFQGFNGVMIDTLDNAHYLETKDPEKYRGMQQAAVNIVKAIRLHYPQIQIMINRAFAIIPKIADKIDMVLAESLYSSYNFKSKEYFIIPREEYLSTLKTLEELKKGNPSLKVFALDYWNIHDTKMIQHIYAEERAHHQNPFVSDINLNVLVPEPKTITE